MLPPKLPCLHDEGVCLQHYRKTRWWGGGGGEENSSNQLFHILLVMFSSVIKGDFVIWPTFSLSSANRPILGNDKSIILSTLELICPIRYPDLNSWRDKTGINSFKHIYFTSIEKQVLTTYTYLYRFIFPGTTPVLAPNVWTNEKIPKLTPAPGNRTWDLKIARPTLYLTTMDATKPALIQLRWTVYIKFRLQITCRLILDSHYLLHCQILWQKIAVKLQHKGIFVS